MDTQGYISQFAGNGKASLSIMSTLGGPATSVSMTDPSDVAVDAADNLYILEGTRIHKVVTDGTISTVANTGSYFPSGLCLDSFGNIYIACAKNNQILKLDTNGNMTTVAGNGNGGFSGDGGFATSAKLSQPNGVAVDSLGNVYIADSGNHRIREILH